MSDGVHLLATTTTCWGVAMALSPTLQIRTMLRTRSSEQVSVAYFAVLTFGFVLWGSYGAAIGEPVLVQVAEHDVLADEDLLLARRLADAGVDVRCTTYAGMIHGFWRHPEAFDASEEALAEAAAFLRERV